MGKIVIEDKKMTVEYSSPRYCWSIGDLTWRSLLGRLPLAFSFRSVDRLSVLNRRIAVVQYHAKTFVALQLCPPLQFGPLIYQPIESVFVSSNQSSLCSCLRHLTSQLHVGEDCSMSFVRFVLLFRWRLVYETVLERFPRLVFGEFYRSANYIRNFPLPTHTVCSYVGELWDRNESTSLVSK